MVDKVNAALKQYIDDGSWRKSLDANVRPSGYSIPDPPTVASCLTRRTRSRTAPTMAAVLDRVLAETPPFDGLSIADRAVMTRAADVRRFGAGRAHPRRVHQVSVEVFVVLTGRVDLWHDADALGEAADERLGPGGVFGFSAMLTERSLGPRAVAVDAVTWRRSRSRRSSPPSPPGRGPVPRRARGRRPRPSRPVHLQPRRRDHRDPPLVVDADDPVGEVAAAMTRRGTGVRRGARWRTAGSGWSPTRCCAAGCSSRAGRPSAPAREVMDASVPTVTLGESAAEALILMLDRDAEYLVVTDRGGRLHGVITPRDFADLPDHRGGLGARADPPGDDGRGAAAPGAPGARRARRPAVPRAWPPARSSRSTRRSSTRSCGGRSP